MEEKKNRWEMLMPDIVSETGRVTTKRVPIDDDHNPESRVFRRMKRWRSDRLDRTGTGEPWYKRFSISGLLYYGESADNKVGYRISYIPWIGGSGISTPVLLFDMHTVGNKGHIIWEWRTLIDIGPVPERTNVAIRSAFTLAYADYEAKFEEAEKKGGNDGGPKEEG